MSEEVPEWEIAGMPIRETTSPALNLLQRDYAELVEKGELTREPPLTPLSEGFESVVDLLNWYQAAAVRTLGHLSERVSAVDLYRDEALRSALCGDTRADRKRRVEFEARRAKPAYHDAFDTLAPRAQEWTGDSGSWEQVDLTERNPAGKPNYRLLDQNQADALSKLWPGFENSRELTLWLSSLEPITGEAVVGATVVDDLETAVIDDESLTRAMLGRSEGALASRVKFAAGALLPMFASKARSLQGANEAMSGARGRGDSSGGNIS